MKVTKLATYILSAALLATATLTGCSNMFQTKTEAANEVTDKAILTVSCDGASRTALPTIVLKDYKYTLSGTHGTNAAKTLFDKASYGDITTAGALAVEPGSWSFTLTVYNGDTAILTDKQTKDLTTGNNTVAFTLFAVEGGTGSVALTLTYPKDSGVASYSVAFYDNPYDTDSVAAKDRKTTSNETITFTADNLASGKTTYVSFFFYDKNGICIGSVPESIYVVPGMTSTEDLTLNNINCFKVTVTVLNDGDAWNNSGKVITLSRKDDSTITYQLTNATGEANSASSSVPFGSYVVNVDGVDAGDLTAKSDGSASTPINYYTVTTTSTSTGTVTGTTESKNPVVKGGTYTFTVSPKTGYEGTAKVNVNESATALTPNDTVYTTKVEGPTSIAVTGYTVIPVQSPKATAGDGKVTLTWTNPSKANTTEITVKDKDGKTVATVTVDAGTEGSVSKEITDLTNDKTYTFEIVTKIDDNTSDVQTLTSTPTAKTYDVTVTVKKDGDPYNDATSVKLNNATGLTKTGTDGKYTGTVTAGDYSVWVDGSQTGATFTVGDSNTTTTVNLFTVTWENPTGATIKSSTGSAIESPVVVAYGGNFSFTVGATEGYSVGNAEVKYNDKSDSVTKDPSTGIYTIKNITSGPHAITVTGIERNVTVIVTKDTTTAYTGLTVKLFNGTDYTTLDDTDKDGKYTGSVLTGVTYDVYVGTVDTKIDLNTSDTNEATVQYYTVSGSGTGATITGSNDPVISGGTYTFTVTPATGFAGTPSVFVNGSNTATTPKTTSGTTTTYEITVNGKTSFTVTGYAVPDVTGLTVSKTDDGSVTLTWTNPTTATCTGTTVYVYEGNTATGTPKQTVEGGTDGTQEITGLTNGKTYTFKVTAKTAGGESTGVTTTGTPSVPLYTAKVTVKIDDAKTKGKKVTLENQTYSFTDKGDGTYTCAVPAGSYTVKVDDNSTGKEITVGTSGGSATIEYFTVTLPTNVTGATATGSTSPVLSGGSYSFTVSAKDTTYDISNVEVKDNGTTKNAASTDTNGVKTYTFDSVTSAHTITVTGVKRTVTVTVNVDGLATTGKTVALKNGSTSYTLTDADSEGQTDGTYTGTVPTGATYDVYVGGSDTEINLAVDTTATATVYYYNVTMPETVTGATVGTTSSNPVLSGKDYVFTVTAKDATYDVSNIVVKDNTTTLTGTGTYTISKITTAPHTVSISGVKRAVKVTVNVDGDATKGKTVTLDTTTLTEQDNGTYTASVPLGTIYSVNVGGSSTGVTLDADSASSAVVDFYTVELPSPEGATVATAIGSTSPVLKNGSYSFTVTAETGYDIGSIDVKTNDGDSMTATTVGTTGVKKYTISEITKKQTVTVDGVVKKTSNTISVSVFTGNISVDAKVANKFTASATGLGDGKWSWVLDNVFTGTSTTITEAENNSVCTYGKNDSNTTYNIDTSKLTSGSYTLTVYYTVTGKPIVYSSHCEITVK